MTVEFAGYTLEKGLAYQAELIDGTIFTGTFAGYVQGDAAHPVFKNVDTGKGRALYHGGCKSFKTLAEAQAEATEALLNDFNYVGSRHHY